MSAESRRPGRARAACATRAPRRARVQVRSRLLDRDGRGGREPGGRRWSWRAGARGEATLPGRVSRPAPVGPGRSLPLYGAHGAPAPAAALVDARRRSAPASATSACEDGRFLLNGEPIAPARGGQTPGDGGQPAALTRRRAARGLRPPQGPGREHRCGSPTTRTRRWTTTWPTSGASWSGPRTATPTAARATRPATASPARWSARTTTTPAS